MKRILSSLPTILLSCWEQDFYVNPSVGVDIVQALLMHKDPKTPFTRSTYFANRVLTAEEKQYTPVERMVLACMFAVVKFQSYLLPKKFIIMIMEESFPYVL